MKNVLKLYEISVDLTPEELTALLTATHFYIDNFGESTSLPIDEMLDVRAKLMEAARKWKDK